MKIMLLVWDFSLKIILYNIGCLVIIVILISRILFLKIRIIKIVVDYIWYLEFNLLLKCVKLIFINKLKIFIFEKKYCWYFCVVIFIKILMLNNIIKNILRMFEKKIMRWIFINLKINVIMYNMFWYFNFDLIILIKILSSFYLWNVKLIYI